MAEQLVEIEVYDIEVFKGESYTVMEAFKFRKSMWNVTETGLLIISDPQLRRNTAVFAPGKWECVLVKEAHKIATSIPTQSPLL